VTSGVPQGSVLGPLLFVIYMDDLPTNITSPLYMFADDTKTYRKVTDALDCESLQQDLNRLSDLSEVKESGDGYRRIDVEGFVVVEALSIKSARRTDGTELGFCETKIGRSPEFLRGH